MSNKKDLSLKPILKSSWKKTFDNIWFLIGLQIAAFAINTIANVSFFGVFVSVLVGAVLYQAFIRINRGENLTFKNILSWMTVDRYFQYLLATIIVSIFVFVGFLLLVIPGIVIAMMLSLVTFIVLDKDTSLSWKKATFWQAIKKSKKLTSGYKWKILGITLVLVLINLLGLLAFVVGLLITIPISGFTMAEVYERLKGGHKEVEAEVIN